MNQVGLLAATTAAMSFAAPAQAVVLQLTSAGTDTAHFENALLVDDPQFPSESSFLAKKSGGMSRTDLEGPDYAGSRQVGVKAGSTNGFVARSDGPALLPFASTAPQPASAAAMIAAFAVAAAAMRRPTSAISRYWRKI